MTEKENFESLLEVLDEAETLVAEFSGGYSDNFFSAEEFHAELKAAIQKLKGGKLEELDKLFVWFAPSYDWDNFVGSEGEHLGNRIFSLILKIKDKKIPLQ
jgi:hypothetical protein